MANLSWQYYNGYYGDFNLWHLIPSKEKAHKDQLKDFFESENRKITKVQLPPAPPAGPDDFELETTYPGLLTGSGYVHETGATGECKIGFQLDHTTGLPILHGSGIKGALRAVFPQCEPATKQPWQIRDAAAALADAIVVEKARDLGEKLQWPYSGAELLQHLHELEMQVFAGLDTEASKHKGEAVYLSIYQRDIFTDAWPVAAPNGLMGLDAITPHNDDPLKNPIPLLFLKVMPGVRYRFSWILRCPCPHGIDAAARRNLFKTILLEQGLGAKTNVGYGQFTSV